MNYKSPDGSFKLSYPGDFEIYKQPNAEFLVLRRNKANPNLFDVAIGVYTSPFDKTADLNNWKEVVRKQTLTVKRSEILQLDYRDNNLYRGIYEDYTFNKTKDDANHNIAWTVLKDNKYYSIIYQSNLIHDKLYLDIGLKMINSFKILTKPSKTDSLKIITSLFKEAKTKLAEDEKLEILRELNFEFLKDKKLFVDKNDFDQEHPFEVKIITIDLNGDGTEEVIANWGNN